MKKSRIQNIIIHTVRSGDSLSRSDRINEFHVQVIEHRLNQSDLTTKQKIAVIEQIIEKLKSREVNGIIG